MNITIAAVTSSQATINGQPLAREYVEGVLLPLLVAAQGKDHSGVLKAAQAFADVGLSLQASPVAVRVYANHVTEQAQVKARLLAEAQAHAHRCQVPTAKEIAERKAERERRAQAIRDHGARIRSQLGN